MQEAGESSRNFLSDMASCEQPSRFVATLLLRGVFTALVIQFEAWSLKS